MKETAAKGARIRINFVVLGEPAEWLKSWKERGIVTSYTDAVIQALRSFHRELVDNEIKSTQLENIKVIQ